MAHSQVFDDLKLILIAVRVQRKENYILFLLSGVRAA